MDSCQASTRLRQMGLSAHGMVFAANSSLNGESQNVKGQALQACSTTGTAITGFERSGKCMDAGNDDAGSHHICIEMKSDFCSVTGQPDWCSEEMECMGSDGKCKIKNWCVCQWAFARYIDKAGGCDKIVEIQCDATNMAAYNAYKKTADKDEVMKKALDCLEHRCGLK